MSELDEEALAIILRDSIQMQAQLHNQRLMLIAIIASLQQTGQVDAQQMNHAYISGVQRTYDQLLATHPLMSGIWKSLLKDQIWDIPGVLPPTS